MDIILHLTHDCQLNCAYCYGGPKRNSAMSWEVARRAIDLLFDQTHTEAPALISFFGGEPLMQVPLLKQCVAYAEAKEEQTAKPFRLAITTNGLSLDETIAEYLRTKNIEPTFSFDGIREAQDACRRYVNGQSSFADTKEAMDLLLRYFPAMSICAVVSPENVKYLPASIDFFLDSGVRRLLLNPNFFVSWSEAELALWRQGYEHAAERFEKEFRNGRSVHINFITLKIITHLKGGYDACDTCDFGQKEIAVAPSGNIYPCQRMVGEDTKELGWMGDVFTGLNVKTCRNLADVREVTNRECRECDFSRRCRNWCSCVNHRLTGRFDLPGSLVCYHERMAIEIADRTASRLFQDKNNTFLETFYFEKQMTPEWI